MYSQQTTTTVQKPARAKATPVTLRGGKTLWVRPFDVNSVADYETVVAINNAIETDEADTVEEWQQWDRLSNPEHVRRRFIAERDGETVAFGHFMHQANSFHEDRYHVWLGVHPEHEGQGYGSALWDHMMAELMKRRPAELVSYTREDRARAVAFLEKRGFEVRLRSALSLINPQAFDAARFAEKTARVAQSGIAIHTLAELRERDADAMRKAHSLAWRCLQDVPSVHDPTQTPFELWQKRLLENVNFMPEGWFIALDGADWVGLTSLWRNAADEQRLHNGLTGVLRSHRRRGIATALKARGLSFARERGATAIITHNEENNPMLQINYQLGYRSLPAELDLHKNLNSGD